MAPNGVRSGSVTAALGYGPTGGSLFFLEQNADGAVGQAAQQRHTCRERCAALAIQRLLFFYTSVNTMCENISDRGAWFEEKWKTDRAHARHALQSETASA